jgi:hypothetical protein
MIVMSYTGIVEDGKVVLPPEAKLPSGTKVRIEPLHEQGLTLAERLKDVIGIVDDLPPDFAKNHDHYIHGAPKK